MTPSFALFALFGCIPPRANASSAGAPAVVVDRAARVLYLRDPAGGFAHAGAIGVGVGGMGEKSAMSDRITPTGTFTIDLVLHREGIHNAVSPEAIARFSEDPTFASLLEGPDGLAQLFANMNGIDFDGDGDPDRAYGSAYVGLHGRDGTTGPKMRYHSTSRTPYWYAIALHGTPSRANLGAANSGGCVHVADETLETLIGSGVLAVGAQIVISDEAPGAVPHTDLGADGFGRLPPEAGFVGPPQ